MTIAICIRVGEGVVVAADSATALTAGGGIAHIYQSARKLIQPHRQLPLGMVTYGQGTLGDQSIAQLAHGLRLSLEAGGQWQLDPHHYTVQDVAERVRDYYRQRIDEAVGVHPLQARLGFLISGYSANEEMPRTYEVLLDAVNTEGPTPVDPGQNWSLTYRGFEDPLDRLVNGATSIAKAVLSSTQVGSLALTGSGRQFVRAEMPLGEAIKVAHWLTDYVVGALRFGPAAEIVGGAIDIARISPEDGFVWVQQQQLPFYPNATDDLL
jgi:hypothetical protein